MLHNPKDLGLRHAVTWLAAAFAWALPLSSQAEQRSFCFAMAESYYEQLYCEIQAKGEGKHLPAFYQFKNNPESTQALLLKRPAAKIGVTIKAPSLNAQKKIPRIALPATPEPTKSTGTPSPVSNTTATVNSNKANREPNPSVAAKPVPASSGCVLSPKELQCAGQRYVLLTNQHNRHLASTALGPENKMQLPRFNGSMANEAAVREYLYTAYEQYLTQMRSIGLAGVTTRFGKFSYLFYDYHEKGLNFSDRFETLFFYLKKDKASLAVSEKAADSQGMTLEQCAWLSTHYYICEHGNNNLIYATQ